MSEQGKRRQRRRPRVALCAAITFDGKLDTNGPPPALRDFLALQDGDRLVEDPAQFRALLDAGQVHDLYLLVRPRVDARRGAPTLSGPFTAEFFDPSVPCRLRRMEVLGGECFLHYTVGRRGR